MFNVCRSKTKYCCVVLLPVLQGERNTELCSFTALRDEEKGIW